MLQHRCAGGFSLFEVLICLAVVGIMAAIALNSFTQGKRDIVNGAINRRNAQAFATIAECAQLAGADPVQGTDVMATLRKIMEGVTPGSGPMAGRTFKIMGMGGQDAADAAYYMKIDHGKLVYEADKPVLMH